MGGILDARNQIQIPTTQNCDSTNGIYCIVYKCNKLYVGETGLSIRKRINIHRSDVRLKKDTAVATHFNSGSCRATHLRVLYLEILKNTGDITLNKIGRLKAERKWQLALKTYSPFGLNTVPSPKDSGVTPFVITYSATAVEAAKLVNTSSNKLKAKHPNILYKRCVTAFKRGQNLRDLLVRSRLGEAPLDNPTKQPTNQPTNLQPKTSRPVNEPVRQALNQATFSVKLRHLLLNNQKTTLELGFLANLFHLFREPTNQLAHPPTQQSTSLQTCQPGSDCTCIRCILLVTFYCQYGCTRVTLWLMFPCCLLTTQSF